MAHSPEDDHIIPAAEDTAVETNAGDATPPGVAAAPEVVGDRFGAVRRRPTVRRPRGRQQQRGSSPGLHPSDFDDEHGVSGVNLGKYYDGYFRDPERANVFPKAARDIVENLGTEVVRILGIGSGPGLPEVLIQRELKSMGFDVELTLSDISPTAMAEHYPGYEPEGKVEKIVLDSRKLDRHIPPDSVHMVIDRCSLHYNPTSMVAIMQKVWEVLVDGGFFITQTQAVPDRKSADFLNFAKRLVGKHSFHGKFETILEMLNQVFSGWGGSVRQPPFQPREMVTTEGDFQDMYGSIIEEKLAAGCDIIQKIREHIARFNERGENGGPIHIASLDSDTGAFRYNTPMALSVGRKSVEEESSSSVDDEDNEARIPTRSVKAV